MTASHGRSRCLALRPFGCIMKNHQEVYPCKSAWIRWRVIQIVHKDTYKEIYHNISDADKLGFVAYNKMSDIQVRLYQPAKWTVEYSTSFAGVRCVFVYCASHK